MEKVKSMLNNVADTSRKYECNTVTGRGPFDVTMGKSIEIEFESRRQLNMAREVRCNV